MKVSQLRRVDAAGLAAIAAMTALAYLGAVRPVMQASRERVLLADRMESEEIANRTMSAELGKLRASLDREREDLLSYPIRLTTLDSMNDRIAEIVRVAQECRLVVLTTEPGELETSTLYGVVGVRLAGRGDYPACADFLHHLNDRFSDVGVRSLSLISQPQNPYDDPLFNFHLLWFVQPDQPNS